MPLSFQARITAHIEESVFMLEVFLFADRDMSTTLCQSTMQNQTCSQVSLDWAEVDCVQ